jgi:proline iminopeptidase
MKKLLILLFLFGCGAPSEDRQGLTDVNGTSLFYHITGKGEPIIIIHGGPVLDQSYMIDHFKELSKNYKLVFFDQRACGRSTAKVDTATMTMKILIEDIEALRKKLNLENVHVLGHSWGGMLAAMYAIEYPLNVKSLILCDAMPPSFELWQQEEKELASRQTAYDSLVNDKITSSERFKTKDIVMVDSLLKFSFRKQFYDTAKLIQLKIEMPSDYFKRSEIFGHIAPELFSLDITGKLNKIISPTLLIYGDHEPALKISGPVYNSGITNSQFISISNSGHFPFIENPEQFNSAITTFLNGINK